jgi:hypothetical protein
MTADGDQDSGRAAFHYFSHIYETVTQWSHRQRRCSGSNGSERRSGITSLFNPVAGNIQ